jgi:CRISPR/Cas system Type II protein with McrA/HNH and RuvC-like nuclease domain
MVKLYDKESGQKLGEISEEQLEFMMNHLEEEGPGDQDYYLTPDTIDLFEEVGADQDLVDTLRNIMAGREELEVRWSQD